MTRIDECGVWRIEEAQGCVNQIIVEPTPEYAIKYPDPAEYEI